MQYTWSMENEIKEVENIIGKGDIDDRLLDYYLASLDQLK